MALTAGQRLGIYEIVSAIGKGGMGEVYRARDTKLQRDVAIKVLPESLATDRDRLARFEREAQLLAALNHPHIAGIYGVDTAGDTMFLVLELVEGDTLGDRISRSGALPVNETIAIARQIAEALQAAHDKGIVHRDLKPSNIALTADNHVKVLDFGLAKAIEGTPAAQSSVPGASMSPTLSMAMTEAGFILGTAAYMSPEQAKGRPADKRSDVWAFGCVLFEMLTGKRVFEGEDVSDTLAGILRGEPDWTALPKNTPPHLREILTGCLAKDRKQRLADIAVVYYLLTEPHQTKPSRPRFSRRAMLGLAGVALLLLAAVIGIAWVLLRRSEAMDVMRFTIMPPPDAPIAASNADRQLAISPDGLKVVYVNASGQLVLRLLGQEEVQVLTMSATAPRSPFWSPDSRWIGFTVNGSNELRKVSAAGGPSILIARSTTPPRGATWLPDDSIIFATADPTSGLMRVAAGGGDPRTLTKPKVAQGEQDHLFPSYVPGGRAVVFAIGATGSTDSSQLAVLDLETGEYRSLIRGGTQPEYVDGGYLVYSFSGSLRAVRFDPNKLTVTSDPVPVLDQVGMASTGATQYSVSRTGTLVYVPGGTTGGSGAIRTLVWVDRSGHETPVAGSPTRSFQYPRLSHDNSRVAVSADDQESDISVFDFALRTFTRATFAPGLDSFPVWFPGDERFLFVSARGGSPNLYAQRADGTGAVERLTKSSNNQFIPTMSPDGKLVVALEQRPGTGNDLVLVRLDNGAGPEGAKSEPIVDTMFSEIHPELSPDGRWLAYVSDDSGMPQVFVKPFPEVSGGKWQVSVNGGSRPAWSPAGGELFYVAPKGEIMSVRVEPGPAFKMRNAEKLFDWPTIAAPGPARTYDVSRDGRRFLMLKEGAQDQRSGSAATIRLVLNWVEELKAKLPAK